MTPRVVLNVNIANFLSLPLLLLLHSCSFLSQPCAFLAALYFEVKWRKLPSLISNSIDRSGEKEKPWKWNEQRTTFAFENLRTIREILWSNESSWSWDENETVPWLFHVSLLMPCLSTGAYRLSMINIFPLPNYKFDRRGIPWRCIFYAEDGNW